MFFLYIALNFKIYIMRTYDLSKLTIFEFTILRDSINIPNTNIGKGEFYLREGERKNSLYFKNRGYRKYFLVEKDGDLYYSENEVENSCVFELIKKRCSYFYKDDSRDIYLDDFKFNANSLYMADLYEEIDMNNYNVILKMSNKMTAYINNKNYTAVILPTN